MADQAQGAVDPLETAAALIANSHESDPIEEDDEEQDDAPQDETEGDESDAEQSATETPKRELLFAGQKFELPEGTPDEVAAKVEEIGKNLQGDYTRKTQELVSREKQAAEIVQRELDQGCQQVQQAINQAHAVIQAFGGLMDPAQQQQLSAYLGQLNQQAQLLNQQAEQVQAQQREAAKQEAWQRLTQEGFSRDTLQKTWNDAKEVYGLSDERLAQVLDADSWLVMRDAIAYRQLKAKAPTVTKAASEAPKLPQAKQPMPKEVREKLDARKAVSRRGGASMRDLAAFIAANR